MAIPDVVMKALDAASVQRVYGEPIERNGVTIIAAAAVRGGGGGGGGTGTETGGTQGEGEGAGFGITARPIGAFVIDDGGVTWQPALDVTRVAMIGNVVALAAVILIWRLLRSK